jgi:hypothetical protein
VEDRYEYYWNEKVKMFILLVNGEELDEFRTENGLRMYAKNAVKIETKDDDVR